MKFSETRKEIAGALAKALGKVETPKHNKKVVVVTKTGSKYDFWYTDLAGINEAIKIPFQENGLLAISNVSTVKLENGQKDVVVSTLILHESGEFMESDSITYTAPSGIQDLGGIITYLKRYSLSATVGIATEKDDDANGAEGNQATDATPPKQTYNKNQNQNKSQNQTPPNQAPPTQDNGTPPPTEVKLISSGQESKIAVLLSSIAKKEDRTKEEVLALYQTKIKAKFDIKKLPMSKASGLITQLSKIESGEVSLYE